MLFRSNSERKQSLPGAGGREEKENQWVRQWALELDTVGFESGFSYLVIVATLVKQRLHFIKPQFSYLQNG